MDRWNDEQKDFVRRTVEEELSEPGGREKILRSPGAMPLEQLRKNNEGLSTLAMDKESRELVGSLKAVLVPTKQSSDIVRTLLIKAGTDCDENDSDPCGDGDQSIVENESQAQVLRELFSAGGDLEHWLLEYRFGTSKLSPFAWMCILGDAKGAEKVLKKTPLTDRRELLETRVTSMRFPLLVLTIALSKHPHTQTVHRYTRRPIGQMDHVAVVHVLLQYGARPNAREVTGKTVCHYSAGSHATKETLQMTDIAIKATETCTCVWKPVFLDGLSKTEYNGLEGILGGYVAETGRRVFHPRDPDKKQLSVKPDNVFLLETKMSITDRSLQPTNLVEVRDRTGAISLHEVVMSKRDDVAKFLLDRSPTCLDVGDYTGTTCRKIALVPVLGSGGSNEVIKQHIAKQERESARKENIRKESCEHCGKHSSELGYELLQCTQCLDAYYCSKECQRADWKEGNHKQECPEREKRGELILGEAREQPAYIRSLNFATNKDHNHFYYGPPKGCKRNDKFWIKVQSNGIQEPLLIYDRSRHCFFELSNGREGHKELVEKVGEDRAFEGRKSFFKAKFNANGKCVVFLHASAVKTW